MRLETHVRDALLQIDYGGTILIEADGTPAVLARLPLGSLKSLAVGFGEMAYADYDPEGPVAVLVFRVFDRPADLDQPLVFDVFLDPEGREDRRVLERLAAAPHIHLHGFGAGPDLPYLESKRLAWRDEHRRGAGEVLARTRAHAGSAPRSRWPEARRRYIRENPLVGGRV